MDGITLMKIHVQSVLESKFRHLITDGKFGWRHRSEVHLTAKKLPLNGGTRFCTGYTVSFDSSVNQVYAISLKCYQ